MSEPFRGSITNRLSRGEQILSVATLLLLGLSLLDGWAKYEGADLGQPAVRYDAWSAAFGGIVRLGLSAAIVTLVLVGAKLTAADLSRLPLPIAEVYLALTGITFAVMAITFLVGPKEAGFGIETSRGFALPLGAVFAAAAAFGAWGHSRAPRPALRTSTPPAAPPPAG